MASVAGRPYNVGFTFRIIGAFVPSVSKVKKVIEYNYNANTFVREAGPVDLLTKNYKLYRGDYIELTAGRGKNQFTVVYIECEEHCEVRIYHYYHHSSLAAAFHSSLHSYVWVVWWCNG